MNTLLRMLFCWSLGFLCLSWGHTQNLALCFDRNAEDFVNLSTAGTPLDGDPQSMTIECWFNTRNPINNEFRRLFTLFGPDIGNGNTRFEVGERAGQLVFFSNLGGGVVNIAPITANTWMQLAVVRNATQVDFYLDCTLAGSATLGTGSFDFDFFRLGRWAGAIAPNADWDGLVDDVRLWSTARTPTEICATQFCPLSCNEANLVANWTFDNDGAASGGNNTGLNHVLDCSPNGNLGTLNNFSLTGSCSNWASSTAPIAFPALHNLSLEIRDYPYQMNLLSGICDGDPVHVCLDDNGQTPGPYSNVTVQWEQSDNGGSWSAVPSSDFVDFCFPVQPGQITAPCPGNTDGFVDRKYRAISTVTGPTGALCEYISEEYDLQICCPITMAQPTLLPGDFFCEGEMINFTVALNPDDPFVATPGPNVTIDWFFVDPTGCTPLPAYANQTQFNFPTWTAPFPPGGVPTQYGFKAEVRNCQGKMKTFPINFTVDPQPVCGTIEGSPLGNPQNLMLISSNPLVYEICPGNDALLEIATPFNYCIPQWQYTFIDPVTATPADWTNMGFSGNIQNINIIPGNSYPWPTGADRIYYRIQCNPLSNPSACDPCFSNVVEVRLKSQPNLPIISGLTQVCLENTSTPLSISNPATGLTYTWYHDGLVIGTGTSINVSEPGCYWVVATDGCYNIESAQHCVEVCETIARISCPLAPNECVCLGDPITLSACASENTCSGNTGTTLEYEWFIDGISQGPPSSNCDITHTPASTGTDYSVIVTDPATGCVGTAMRTIVPCDKN